MKNEKMCQNFIVNIIKGCVFYRYKYKENIGFQSADNLFGTQSRYIKVLKLKSKLRDFRHCQSSGVICRSWGGQNQAKNVKISRKSGNSTKNFVQRSVKSLAQEPPPSRKKPGSRPDFAFMLSNRYQSIGTQYKQKYIHTLP